MMHEYMHDVYSTSSHSLSVEIWLQDLHKNMERVVRTQVPMESLPNCCVLSACHFFQAGEPRALQPVQADGVKL